MDPDYDIGAHIRKYVREDPRSTPIRDNLESKIAELIPGSDEQLEMLEYVETHYATAVRQIALNAYMRAFREWDEHTHHASGNPASDEKSSSNCRHD